MSKSKMPLAAIPFAGRARRLVLLLLLPALALAACGGGDAPEVEVPAEPSAIGDPDLLGYWELIEVNERVPPSAETRIRYQFTAQGDFIRYTGAEVERARYSFASPDQLLIDGPTGPTFYDYELRNDVLTLRQPGDGGESLTLRKLADQNLEDVPPSPVSVPEEDSLPPDSM